MGGCGREKRRERDAAGLDVRRQPWQGRRDRRMLSRPVQGELAQPGNPPHVGEPGVRHPVAAEVQTSQTGQPRQVDEVRVRGSRAAQHQPPEASEARQQGMGVGVHKRWEETVPVSRGGGVTNGAIGATADSLLAQAHR